MAYSMDFKKFDCNNVGIELELQLINLNTYNLILESSDFLRRLKGTDIEHKIKPEVTQSMLEINSSPHQCYNSLLQELQLIKAELNETAKIMHIGICGAGTHPFQKWKEQKVFQNDRFLNLTEQYGYLTKQFTVFGQHIHISCKNGDDALYLCHALAYFIPHLIALSASSPFSQGVDTSFDCSRLSAISAFPLSGTPPWIFNWNEFEEYFQKLINLNIANTMKDCYWDIRPKPEYGTVEIRIVDTPLTIQKAADIAFFAYNLSQYLLDERKEINRELYLVYFVNRFRASRFGLTGLINDIYNKDQKTIKDDILHICYKLESYARKSESMGALERIRLSALNEENDAAWLRSQLEKYHSLEDVVRSQMEIWERG